jgi:aminopeptidase N
MGELDPGLTDFVQQVTAHEVGHQWWGHVVGWESYRDQWILEGFAELAASIFVQKTGSRADYYDFWEKNRKALLEKNRFGHRAVDVGPMVLGIRLSTFETPAAYNKIAYAKAGFVLHMLRLMMWEQKSGDSAFINMCQDFLKQNLNKNVSTEALKETIESHMPPSLNPDPQRRMNWFFDQWVYGCEIPSYRLEYIVEDHSSGRFLLTGSVTQSGVSDKFRMPVPVYADFDGRVILLTRLNLVGNEASPPFRFMLPQRPTRVIVNAYQDILSAETSCYERGRQIEVGFSE